MPTKKNPEFVRTKMAAIGLIEAHCQEVSPGVCRYEEGWNDARVSKESGASPATVRYYRQYGKGEIEKIVKPKVPTRQEQFDALQAQVEALTERVEALENAVTAPTLRFGHEVDDSAPPMVGDGPGPATRPNGRGHTPIG